MSAAEGFGSRGGAPFIIKHGLTPESAERLWHSFAQRYVSVCAAAGKPADVVAEELERRYISQAPIRTLAIARNLSILNDSKVNARPFP
eukprot:5188743-Amphidinium_carterae.1